jgi:hypothetical protein
MPKYKEVPDAKRWLDDAGQSSLAAMERISDLISQYNELRDKETELPPPLQRRGAIADRGEEAQRDDSGGTVDYKFMEKLFVEFLMERASGWMIKNKDHKDRDRKLGGKLDAKQIQAVEALHKFVYEDVKTKIVATDKNYNARIIEYFGRIISQEQRDEDQHNVDLDQLTWLLTPEEQKELKLSFRSGLAAKWSFEGPQGKKKKEVLGPYYYDTEKSGDAISEEFNGSLYAMDRSAIYVCGQKDEKKLIKHSSLLAGASVLCAGTIRIEDGQVKWLTGKSGHYLPTLDHVLSVLERLRQYQVDLTNVTVYRENFDQAYDKPGRDSKKQPNKHFEPCNALILLKDRVWPGAPEHAKSLHVRAPGPNTTTTTTTTIAGPPQRPPPPLPGATLTPPASTPTTSPNVSGPLPHLPPPPPPLPGATSTTTTTRPSISGHSPHLPPPPPPLILSTDPTEGPTSTSTTATPTTDTKRPRPLPPVPAKKPKSANDPTRDAISKTSGTPSGD